jgi:hypothetical protein
VAWFVSNITKAHDLETVVHCRHQKVTVSSWRRMPLDPPSTTSDVCLSKWCKKFPGIKQPDGAVVTANSDKVLRVRVALDASHTSVEPEHALGNGCRHSFYAAHLLLAIIG